MSIESHLSPIAVRHPWWQRLVRLRRHRSRTRARIPRSTIALLAISIILPMVLFGLAALQNWRDVQRVAEHHVERTTRILHEHALNIFESQRLVLDQINERLRITDWNDPRDVASLHDLLTHLRLLLPQVVDIVVTDAGGHVRASGLDTPGESTDVSDRDYFKVLKASDQTLPYVSHATIGKRTGIAVFNVAARIRSRGNRFTGVIVIALDQSYFGDFYRDIEQGYTQTVVLARDDGSVLASDPPMADTMLPPNALIHSNAAKGSDNAVVIPSVIDGIRRIFGYERVGAYPVVIGFGITSDSAAAQWWRNMRGYGLVAVLSSLALLGVSGFAIRRIRLEGKATVKWRLAAAQLKSEMAQRARVEEQLRQAQKMEAVGQLTGGIAHDFNNLLTVVIGNLDLLSRRMSDADPRHRALIKNAIDGASRAASLTSRLLSFSRQQPLDPRPLDANVLVTGMSTLLGRTLGEAISIDLALADDLDLTFADPNQLENAILNLCVNAVDAMPNGGKLTIETRNVTLDPTFCASAGEVKPGRYVAISVTDTGSGMPAEVIKRAFEPFFTTKPVGKGTGLGLSQLYGFARQSDGHADISSELGKGTTIRIYLPRIEAADAVASGSPAASPAEPAPTTTLGTTILIVEDDDLVRQFSSGALRDAGFRVLEAATGAEGLRELQANPDIALLFADVVLRGSMHGRELADRAGAIRPGLPILFTTGYTKDAIVHDGRLDEDVHLIGKPFTTAALTARITELLTASAPAAPAPVLSGHELTAALP